METDWKDHRVVTDGKIHHLAVTMIQKFNPEEVMKRVPLRTFSKSAPWFVEMVRRLRARTRAREWRKLFGARKAVTAALYREANRELLAQKQSAYMASFSEEERQAIHHDYYLRHREEILQYGREYAQTHRETINARRRVWNAKHPEKKKRDKMVRRAREFSAEGFASRQQIRDRVAFYGHRCAYCGGPYEELDHVIPLARGGSNWPANLRPACHVCNHSKHGKTLQEWRS